MMDNRQMANMLRDMRRQLMAPGPPTSQPPAQRTEDMSAQDLLEHAIYTKPQPASSYVVKLQPSFNRIYSKGEVDRAKDFKPTHFSGHLLRGGYKYFCPNGWRRYALDVGIDAGEFDKAYDSWRVCFHGLGMVELRGPFG